MKIFSIYFLIISCISFLLMYIDKQKAIKREWRIPESTLMTLSLIGGAVGTYLGMYTFRHKTKHTKFTIGVPICIVINIFSYYFLT
ncbi:MULTISPECIES: DUF1294 domain-containing protein [Paraclostridium]|uniref:Membrane protein n=1 Tax=Paraclostridium benzoelyticum TaxID=1629550 RepID=A0A0M3DGY3_9FIRM|nr:MULTISPECIES: DUF1294 domain-containing protein [Paraclostridium]KKY01558.1 membrane protein [Paraclostridium benzoelyticum]MCU9815150.1 DUF1294 domain-containing protein [Paraclostridium sp. AKS73]MDM8127438.1 DUF1294 domain-containing protein [Paraclostridium benzoelyticum]OXX85051.1 hypothetical protein AVM15_00875 [Paraclostridium benzoelyticum]